LKSHEAPSETGENGLVLKTVGLADVLRSALLPLADTIDIALVYGSQATGEASAISDVDLPVVADVDELTLHKAIGRAEAKLSHPINYTLLDRHEFNRRRKQKRGFLARVLSGEKIIILGSLDAV
jgi:predicted nucleotidyltransferase